MESTALGLYRQTAAWLQAGPADLDTPALGAVVVVRQIADGYALLANSWGEASRAPLSLPSSLLLGFGMQRAGIAEWAAEHGHPLELSDDPELAEALVEGERDQSKAWDLDLAAAFVASLHHYEMLALLCDSPSGRAALHIPELKGFAAGQINDARQSAGWTWHHAEEAAGVAAARIFIAQAYFVATRETVSSSDDIFPSRETLGAVLRQSDAYAWLERQDVELPQWLDPADD
jgi:hypothetical protein